MNTVIKRVWNQNRMTKIEDLSGMAFQAEAQGHTFEISGTNDAGEAVTLSGTVSGVFMRPDGSAVPLTGSISGGKALLTLDADCYAISGRFVLTMFLASGTQNTSIYAAVGSIMRSTGDTPYVAPAYVKLYETEISATTTSTSATILDNIDISPASDVWTSAYQIFVSIRDKAGKRAGYFFGADTIISNPLVGTSATAIASSAIARNTYTYTPDSEFAVSTQSVGVYVYDVNSSGRIRIATRYNSSSSLTIDGTYKIEVYALTYPDNVSPFA